MKRMITAIIALAFFIGLISVMTGCAGADGRYFNSSRDNKPRTFKNRLYNPADYRYANDDATD